MKTSVYNVRLRRNRRSYDDILAENPMLLYGEVVFVYGVEENQPCDFMKVGNGRDVFSSLPWYTDIAKIDKTLLGKPNGIAVLDNKRKILMEEMPESLLISIREPEVESPEYTGELVSPTLYVDDLEAQTISGTANARSAGTYYVAVKPTQDHCWEDGSTDTKLIAWEVKPQTIPYPRQTEPAIYDGMLQAPILEGYDAAKMDMTGELYAIARGGYVITVTPKSDYQWEDGTQDPIDVVWVIQ